MTQEELKGNHIILHYAEKGSWPDMIIRSGKILEYHESMDWLYPVYQKIATWFRSEERELLKKKDSYAHHLLLEKFNDCSGSLIDAKPISEIFKEIVSWIKIYNLKVLEDDKT